MGEIAHNCPVVFEDELWLWLIATWRQGMDIITSVLLRADKVIERTRPLSAC
jgi:hypothetical protein